MSINNNRGVAGWGVKKKKQKKHNSTKAKSGETQV